MIIIPLKRDTQRFHTLYIHTRTAAPLGPTLFSCPGRDVPAADERRQLLHAHNHLGNLLLVLFLNKAARLSPLLLLLMLALQLPEVVAVVVVVVVGLILIRRGGCGCRTRSCC